MSRTSRVLAAGAAVAAAAGAACLAGGLPAPAAWTAAVAVLCAVYWVLEPIPIAATSLLPFAILPLAGVSSHKQVASAYGNSIVLLLLGGFMLSAAVEKSGGHRRLAMAMVRLTGSTRRRLVLGFMLATAILSAWISNSATTLMMMPVAAAVVEGEADDRLATPLFLGVAYAASLGGMATPVGTPPNLIFMAAYARLGTPYSFVDWMRLGVPIAAVLVPLCAWYLSRKVGDGPAPTLPRLAPARPAERRMLIIFGLTALAWVFRAAPGGGWTGLLGLDTVGDSTVALAAVALLFVLPDGEGQGARMLDWDTCQRMPWGLLLLFGGGIAIADAFEHSGLSGSLANLLSVAASWPTLALLVTLCLGATFLSEIASNTALATLLMPILAAAAKGTSVPPALLMVPATLAASCGFMLPVATAPNAIVFGTGRVTARAMARAGLALDLVGSLVIAVVAWLLL
jgi:sodium-dependent dicarboxylate transporter 2/3/5